MTPNHIPITQEQFDRIAQSNRWEIQEMPLEVLRLVPKIVRPKDHLGGYISGCKDQPKMLNRYSSIAAFEVLVFESNPKLEWNEGFVNAYHYIFRKSGHVSHPYILSGPYVDDTVMGHHPADLNLDVYQQ